jgi:hypothetical protein
MEKTLLDIYTFDEVYVSTQKPNRILCDIEHMQGNEQEIMSFKKVIAWSKNWLELGQKYIGINPYSGKAIVQSDRESLEEFHHLVQKIEIKL